MGTSRNDNLECNTCQKCIQNLLKKLRWSFLPKELTVIFVKSSVLPQVDKLLRGEIFVGPSFPAFCEDLIL